MKRQGNTTISTIHRGCYFVCMGMGIFALISNAIFYFMGVSPWNVLPPCVFYSTTGYYCFGCGGTRAVKALFHGKVLECAYYHPFVIYTTVLYMGYIVMGTLHLISKGKIKAMPLLPVYGYIGAALIILQCLVKNYLVYRYGWQI